MRVLILEDQRVDAELLVGMLEAGGLGFTWRRVDNEADFREAANSRVDLVLADYHLPDYSARDALIWFRQQHPDIPFILVSGKADETTALGTIALGATDYIFKDRLGRLGFAVTRALAERRFRESHKVLQGSFEEESEKYREFVEGTEDLVVQTDPEGRYTFVNTMAQRYLGLPPEQCLGVSAFEFVHPEDRETTRAAFAGWVSQKKRFVRFSNRLRSKRNEVYHLSWTINLHYDARGDLRHLNAIAQDTTEQKRLQCQLQETIRKHESILEASPAAIYALDADGTVLSWNRAAERIFGWTTEEVVGRPNPVVPEESWPEFQENLRMALSGEGVFQKELVRRTRDGRSIDISLSAAPLRDDLNQVVGVMAIIFDITERKQLEAYGQRQTLGLAKRVRELNGFFSLTDLINTNDLPTEDVFRRAVNLLPPTLLHPGAACARLRIACKEYCSEKFVETPWRMAATIGAESDLLGTVEVFYRSEMPPEDEGPFLVEERRMLDTFAERIGSYLRRREAMKALSDFRMRQQHLLSTNPAIVFSASAKPPYETTFVSDNVQSILGYGVEEFLGSSSFWQEQIHPDDLEKVEEKLQGLEVGETHTSEYRFRHAEGSWRWMSETSRLLGDAAGNPLEFVGAWSEITERKQSEAELLRLNHTLRVISRCNEALVRARSEQELVDRIQKILVESGYPLTLVWLDGAAQDESAPIIHPRKGQEFFAAMIAESCHVTELIRDSCRAKTSQEIPLGQAFASCGKCSECLELAESLQLRSAFTLFLGSRDDHIGCLVIFSKEEEFIEPEIELLEELSDDLAYGIGSLRTEAAHLQAQEFLRLRNRAIEASSNGIMISEAKLPEIPIIYVNPAFEKITGYPAEEVLGRNPRLLSGQDQKQPGLIDIRSAIKEGGSAKALVRNYRKDGELFWNELSVSPIVDAQGRLTHFVSVINDVTERKRYEEEIERHANFDQLTGLANRNLFSDRIRQAIAHSQRAGLPMALILLDLDRFQIINDSLGHSVGNELLKLVAERLESCLRSQDTLARLGGDEFVFLVQDIKEKGDLQNVVEKIRACLVGPFTIGSRRVRVTASIGVSLFPEDGRDEEILLRNADLAMYHAKDTGRDSYQFFAADMDAQVMEAMDLEADLRQAIERQELVLHFQPKVDVPSGRIVGCEALVRWVHPKRGMVSPGAFIPLAEETGLIEPIGEWVLREACRTNVSFQKAGLPPVTVAVNISARQFRNESLAQQVAGILRETGMESRWLDLELTESMLMHRPERATEVMNQLKEIGISLSLDDFGTGYSSLNYLRRFPIDTLKIDRSFIADVEKDEGSASVACTIVDIAHNLHIKVVAEGVETAGQLEFLRQCDCTTYQGFFFSRPVPPAQFAELLRKSSEFP